MVAPDRTEPTMLQASSSLMAFLFARRTRRQAPRRASAPAHAARSSRLPAPEKDLLQRLREAGL